MESEKRAVRGITNSDIDPQGNVTLWDHGPSEPGPLVERDSDEYKRLEAEAKAWHAKHGDDAALPIVMAHGDAVHAMQADPARYSIEPDVDESEVEAEIEKIQEQRAETEKVAADRADAGQMVVDRKAAVAVVQAKRRAAHLEAQAPKPRTEPQFEPQPTEDL